jgi:Cupin domain.
MRRSRLIDGALTFVADDERFLCETGASWIVPRGIRHTFRVESETMRLVAVYAPAGMDHCIRNAGLPADGPALPPGDAPTRPLEEIEEAMRKLVMTTSAHQWAPTTSGEY